MEYAVLASAILILGLMGWRGYSAGIMKMVVYVIALILSIAITGMALKPVSTFIKNNTEIYEGVEESVRDVVSSTDIYNTDQLEQLPFPQYILNQAADAMGNSQLDVTDVVVKTVSEQIYGAIIYIILNIVIYLAIRTVLGVLGIVAMLPIIKEVNKLFGLLLGLAEGIIILWLICMLLQACAGQSWAQNIFMEIESSSFLSWIYNNNIIEMTIAKKI